MIFVTPIFLNPIIISILMYFGIFYMVRRVYGCPEHTARNRFYRKSLLFCAVGLLVYLAVDTVYAHRRVSYGDQVSSKPIINTTISAPRSIVLVNIQCDQKCLDRLVDGIHDEVIFVSTINFEKNVEHQRKPPFPAVRYSVIQAVNNTCPSDPDHKPDKQWTTSKVNALQAKGICPIIEPAKMPQEGIFIVKEALRVSNNEPPREFSPQLLTIKFPGRIDYYNATQVQNRSKGKIDVLAQLEAYEAPGYLGFPPMLGCWRRPDNIVFILPLGDTGCGLWRRIVKGGDQGGKYFNVKWVYSQVFGVTEPKADAR